MENDLYMDYVKVETIYTNDNAERIVVPMILMLDSSVISVSVTDIYGGIASVLIYKGVGDNLSFDVEVNKLQETFEAIYEALNELWDDDDDDDETNVD